MVLLGKKAEQINFGIIGLTDFVKRQWKSDFAGTKMSSVSNQDFIETVNLYSKEHVYHLSNDHAKIIHKSHPEWEFCKYLIFSNPYKEIRSGAIPLSLEHYPFIRTGYSKRTDSELSFLSRWLELPPGFKPNSAEALCIVLYSNAQLEKEHYANDITKNTPFTLAADYGIVAILGLPSFEISPPPPITILRNALGKEYGGNGQPLNNQEYLDSVKYWDQYILCK